MLLSDANINTLSEKWPRLAHLSGPKGEKTFGEVMKAIEIVGVGGAMSYMNAKHASPGRNAYEIMGVPADLALGLIFSGFAVTGYFGEHADHAQNVGIGFLAAYACRMGSVWGASSRTAKVEAALGTVRGAFAAPHPFQPAEAVVPQGVPQQYPWAA
jgi:hypothetical protein